MGVFIKFWKGPCPVQGSPESMEHVYTKSKVRIKMNDRIRMSEFLFLYYQPMIAFEAKASWWNSGLEFIPLFSSTLQFGFGNCFHDGHIFKEW